MCGIFGGLRLLFAMLTNCAKLLKVCGVLKIVLRFAPSFCGVKKLCETLKVCGVLKIVRYSWRFAPSFCVQYKSCAKQMKVCGVLKIVRYVCAFFCGVTKLCETLKVCGVLKIVRSAWRFTPFFLGLKKDVQNR